MEDILDSIRHIISRWVQTATLLTADASAGDTILTVQSTKRFQVGDEVMIKNPQRYETLLIVEEILSNTSISLSSPILNDWTIDEGATLIKTINQMFIQGIYIGDPEVIPMYPAITVDGKTRDSEWLTLDSTKERYELEINTYVLESTHEDGYRFLLNITKTIEDGLKKNIFPIVGDYDTVSLLADVEANDRFWKVSDTSLFTPAQRRIVIENPYQVQEAWVQEVIDNTTIYVDGGACYDFSKSDSIVIVPNRFIFNSWPSNTNFGKVHKGTLLKASTISWFGEEEEVQLMRKQDPHLV